MKGSVLIIDNRSMAVIGAIAVGQVRDVAGAAHRQPLGYPRPRHRRLPTQARGQGGLGLHCQLLEPTPSRTDPFTVHPEVIPHLAFAGVRGLAQQNRGDSGRDAHDGRMLFETHDGGRLRIHAARFDSEPIAIQVADVRLHAVRQFIVDECAGAAFRMSFPG